MPAVVESVTKFVGDLVGPVGQAVLGTVFPIFVLPFGPVFASEAVSRMLTPERDSESQSTSEEAQGRSVMIRSSTADHRIIYGEVLVSGAILFWNLSGTTNQYFHIIVALAGHECQEIGDVFFDDVLATDPKFASVSRIKKHLGEHDAAADLDLTADVPIWTVYHRLRGITYVYVRLTYDTGVWTNGVPNIRAVVKGKKVWDPRTDTTAYSANAALCQLDYLMSSQGIGALASEIDEASWIAAANICDENVTLAGGGTVKRYTCNGSAQRGERPIDIMSKLLSASNGVVTFAQGKYRGYAGAYASPTVTLTEDDLRGPLQIQPRPARRDLVNAVRGVFVDSTHYWQATDFPPQTNAAYVEEDGGQECFRDIELPFTTNHPTAQRIAKMNLESSRRSVIVQFPAKLTALQLACWDTVQVSIAYLGWSSKVFRIIEWSLSEEGGVDLLLKEEDSTIYSWSAEELPLAEPDELDIGSYTIPPPMITKAISTIPAPDYYTYGWSVVNTQMFWETPTDSHLDSEAIIEIQCENDRHEFDTGTRNAFVPSYTVGPFVDYGTASWCNFGLRFKNSSGVYSAWASWSMLIGVPPSWGALATTERMPVQLTESASVSVS